jgi:hypothetical protein
MFNNNTYSLRSPSHPIFTGYFIESFFMLQHKPKQWLVSFIAGQAKVAKVIESVSISNKIQIVVEQTNFQTNSAFTYSQGSSYIMVPTRHV